MLNYRDMSFSMLNPMFNGISLIRDLTFVNVVYKVCFSIDWHCSYDKSGFVSISTCTWKFQAWQGFEPLMVLNW